MAPLLDWLPILWEGFQVTIALTVISFVLTVCLSVLVAICALSDFGAVRWTFLVYIEVFRSIPLLAFILLVYYGGGPILAKLALSGFWAAVIALVVIEVAYTAEVYRVAILSVRRGQWDAAASIGLSSIQTYRHVVLPQAVLPAMPPTINLVIYIIQGTTLASVIGVAESTHVANSLISETFQALTIYLLLAAMYLSLTVPIGLLGRYVEKCLLKMGVRADGVAK